MDKELQVVDLNTSHEYCKGDLLWVETPRNPGECSIYVVGMEGS